MDNNEEVTKKKVTTVRILIIGSPFLWILTLDLSIN